MLKLIFVSVLVAANTLFAADKITELNLELAKKIADKAAACGAKNKWKLSIAIVNAEGNLIYFHRTDGAYIGSIDAAIDKARSASLFERPTKVFSDGLKDGRMGLLSVKNVVGIEGGWPIQTEEKHLGGLGISGAKSTEDETCAKTASFLE